MANKVTLDLLQTAKEKYHGLSVHIAFCTGHEEKMREAVVVVVVEPSDVVGEVEGVVSGVSWVYVREETGE